MFACVFLCMRHLAQAVGPQGKALSKTHLLSTLSVGAPTDTGAEGSGLVRRTLSTGLRCSAQAVSAVSPSCPEQPWAVLFEVLDKQ